MIVLYIILIPVAFLFALLLSFLLLKIRILINTDEGVLKISQSFLYSVRAFTDPSNPAVLRIKVFGIPFTIDLLKMGRKKNHSDKPVVEKKKVKQKRTGTWINIGKMIKSFLRAFHVRFLHLSFDTGDFTLNAQLFPAVHTLNMSMDDRYWLEVNFTGENYLHTQIETRPIKVLLVIIKTKLKS